MQQYVLLHSKCRNNSVLAPFSKICELTRAAVQEKLISLQAREKQLAIHKYSNCVYLPLTLNKSTIVKFKTAAFKH